MSKKLAVFIFLFILAGGFVYLYLRTPEIQKKVACFTEENFQEDNIYTDVANVSERLKEEIEKGTDSFVVYLKDFDLEELSRINETQNGILGSGESYQLIGNVGNTYQKVAITIRHTSNYYAVSAYLHQAPIPEEDTKAQELYEVISNILDTCISEDMTDYEKELALHDYLVTHCSYNDEEKALSDSDIYRAYGALVNQKAVCNGYAEAMHLLLMCAGVNTNFVTGSADGVDHAWNLVELDHKWYHLDTTWDDPVPDQGEMLLHPYFNVTDEIMSESHEWKKEDYPEAVDMTYNFYVQNHGYFYDFDAYKESAYDRMVGEGQERYEAVIENYSEKEEDMQFIFENNDRFNSVKWQIFGKGKYRVLVMDVESL